MTPSLRKFALTAHIILSVGWLGAVVAYLALSIVGLTSHSAQMVRAAYLSMEFIGWYIIVPFSLATLLAGLVESLGTQWGLFRHWWVLAKFLLITGATMVLLRHMQAVTAMAGVAAETTLSSYRLPRAADSPRGPRWGRPAGVARGNGARGIQAVGHDPVRAA